jgi:hypothetical protein
MLAHEVHQTTSNTQCALPPGPWARIRYLLLPGHPKSWEALMGGDKRKGALKSSTKGHISAVRAFEGPHPDAGTMRMIIQGVQEANGKVQVIVHPDTTFTGAARAGKGREIAAARFCMAT